MSALASWLDAKAHGGTWLVRIEDVDQPRTVPGADRDILETLAAYGLHADAPPIWQRDRDTAYDTALAHLQKAGLVYPCGCTRREIADALAQSAVHRRHLTLAYPGTCRNGLQGRPARTWRLRVPDGTAARFCHIDRFHGPYAQNLASEVGDFALRRGDGQWAYQLAVVVDDAAAGVTDVVRGADLLDSTPRQIYLQQCLGVPTPRYLHVPVLNDAHGEKLSKQTGASALPRDPVGIDGALRDALRFLQRHMGLPEIPALSGYGDALGGRRDGETPAMGVGQDRAENATHIGLLLEQAVQAWRHRFIDTPPPTVTRSLAG
jgi:glutamyl-Q tRNA(Asp) synthetase